MGAAHDASFVFIELGAPTLGLAVLARLASRFGFSSILVARGEFSIVIAGLGVTLEPRIGPLSAAYVLFLAVLGPILTASASKLDIQLPRAAFGRGQ